MWDLVVVGAGISGAGVARDASRRGLTVLVVDAADVAHGTSSRSTRLIHGGVRYLEQGQIGLVYEALRERSRLYRAAAHLVEPTRFLFPAYSGDRLGPWMLRMGLALYDALNLFRGEGHDAVDAQRCLELEPLLAADGLRGAVLYEDAVTDDARLTLAVLQDARRHGADVLTYAPVERLARADDGIDVHLDGGQTVRGREVVVATGPWTGPGLLGHPGQDVVHKSKGVHVVLRAEDVPVDRPVVIQAPGDSRRILFVVPWGSRTYVGTTDTPYEGDPRGCGVVEPEELELLSTIKRVMPNARLEPDAIISTWAGVRPLVRPEGAVADSVELSRKHRIVHGESGALGLVGGKLTTFRAMAEEVVDEVVRRLRPRWPEDRAAPRACSTADAPLVPLEPPTDQERADPLFADLYPRHGPAARLLAERARGVPELEARIVSDLPYRRIELDHAITHEGAQHVSDVLRRRIPLALTDPALGGAVAREVAQRLVTARGGGAVEVEDELDRYRDEVRRETRRVPRIDPSPTRASG
jgi:glycerol-3-phosphate dehydrogenase